jgi:hypothetical protein
MARSAVYFYKLLCGLWSMLRFRLAHNFFCYASFSAQ